MKLWDVRSGKLLGTLEGKRVYLGAHVAFSPDGKTLGVTVERSSEETDRPLVRRYHLSVELWDVSTRKVRQTFDLPADHGFFWAFSADGKSLIVRGAKPELIRYELASGKQLGKQSLPDAPAPIRVLSLSADGTIAAVLAGKGRDRLWTVDKEGSREFAGYGPSQPIEAVALSPDGQLLATGRRTTLIIWSAANGRERARWVLRQKIGIQHLAFSPDGKLLAIAGRAKEIILWDLKEGGPHPDFKGVGHRGSIGAMAISPDGKTLATASEGPEPGSTKAVIRLWDLPAAKKDSK